MLDYSLIAKFSRMTGGFCASSRQQFRSSIRMFLPPLVKDNIDVSISSNTILWYFVEGEKAGEISEKWNFCINH